MAQIRNGAGQNSCVTMTNFRLLSCVKKCLQFTLVGDMSWFNTITGEGV